MKRFLFLLLVLCLCTTTVFATNTVKPVVDDADLLFEREESELTEKISEIRKKTGVTISVITANSYEDYTDDFQGDYIYLQISVDTRDWEVFTGGEGNDIIPDSRLDEMADAFVPLLSEGAYAEAFTLFATQCEEAIDIYHNGEPFEFFPILFGSLILGLIVALIATGVMRRKLKSVRNQRAAANYVRPGSMQLTQSADLYLYSRVSRIKKPENNNSGRSFSGTSHGGRGGKF